MSEVEQLRAELEQARSRLRLLQSVFDHAPAFVAHIMPDGRFLFLNRVPPEREQAILSTTIYEWSDPADHPVMRAAIAKVVATGEQADFESSAGVPGEQRNPYYTRVAPLMNDGVVESVVLIATDVTKLKKTEADLLESQAILQHVLAVTETGMWWWDLDRNVGFRDERTERLFGVDVTHADKQTLTDFVHPDDRARVYAAFHDAVLGKGTAVLEHRMVRADGEIRWINASAALIEGPFGRRLLGGVRDVTERKLLEEKLATAQKLESIGRLAGGIAHDFNNMLTVITSNTDRMLRKVPESSPLHRDLVSVRAAAERSTTLTSQLLVFARRQMTTPAVFAVDDLIRRVEEPLRRTLGRDTRLVTDLATQRHVRIDAGQLEQLLMNLASNARDAMPRGGTLTIATSDVVLDASQTAAHPGVQPGSFVKVRVADTGDGIAAADLTHIFEPFFTTKELGKGTGLGLATCYGIVTQNSGFMTVTSSPGNGATFEIFLPSVEPAAATATPS